MIKAFYILIFVLAFGRAQAEADFCQQGVESLARSRQIPFQFETNSQKLKNAFSFDTNKNPKTYSSKEGVSLQVFETNQKISKYVVTHIKNCQHHCDHLSISFDVDYPNGECRIQRAQIKDDLNERTLWTRPICQEIKKSKHLYDFISKHGQWISEFSIQRRNLQDPEALLKQISSNCQKYDRFYEGASSAGISPAGSSSKPAGAP